LPQCALFIGREHLLTLLQAGAHTAMAFRHITISIRQNIESVFKFIDDLRTGKHPRPGRCQLDGQRHTPYQATDTKHILLLGAQVKIRTSAAGGLLKEAQRNLDGVSAIRVLGFGICC
jgi:hypothetical protein